MGFLLHKFAHFVHALRLFKALRLFFLTNFPGPTVIPCPTSIPDSRVPKTSIVSYFTLHLRVLFKNRKQFRSALQKDSMKIDCTFVHRYSPNETLGNYLEKVIALVSARKN